MESRDTDDWVDKFMLIAANYSKPVAEEWFKLCQWFLVLAALSFLSEVGEHNVYDIALGISMIILWGYFMFHYQKLWYRQYNKTVSENPNWGFWHKTAIHSLGALATLMVASGMLSLAALFGSEAAAYLHLSTSK